MTGESPRKAPREERRAGRAPEGRHDVRTDPAHVPAPVEPVAPEPRRPRRAVAWAAGLVLLAALVAVMLTGAAWPLKVAAWILLTLLLDEAGGWFGYLGAAVGVLPLWVAPPLLVEAGAPAVEGWDVVFGLVFSGLIAMLIVKHTGGPLAALLSLAAFAVPVVGAHLAGPFLDETITVPLDPAFLPFTLGPAALGAAVGFVRSLVVRRRERIVTATA